MHRASHHIRVYPATHRAGWQRFGLCLVALCLACGEGAGPDTPVGDTGLPPVAFDIASTSDTVTTTTPDVAPPVDTATSQDIATVDSAPPADAGEVAPDKVTRTFGVDTVSAEVLSETDGLRTYRLSTSHKLRCGPDDKQRQFSETADRPRLRSGNVLFDALYALALHEVGQLSTDTISDGAFNNGKPVDCHCFQTGEKWPWAWTRDTAYAIDLALAAIDPLRARDTVLSRLSGFKAGKSGKGPQVMQDTGTGGSWPVSSDRAVWALGARAVWRQLDGAERKSFGVQVKAALQAMAEVDDAALKVPGQVLLRGEQSFLDWREQSYPSWTAIRPADIAMSQALSTNIGHLLAREFRRVLSGEGGDEKALRAAIHDGFYLQQRHLYSALRTTGLDTSPAERFDLLGNSLAVLHDIADTGTAADVVASYPVVAAGPPVQWPQQQLVPIYHNRAQWPFVTAYWLLAAARTGNAEVANNAFDSLIRGAALNLSNMENFEFLSGGNHVQDGEYSGPVVNSCRQLWSVAGYVAAIQGVLFGMQPTDDGLRVKPFVSRAMRNDWLKNAKEIHLLGVTYRGRQLDLALTLPKVGPPTWGPLGIANHIVNGKSVPAGEVVATALEAKNTWIAQLADVSQPAADMVLVTDDGDYRTFFGPKEPKILSLSIAGEMLKLNIDPSGEKEVVFDVFRDGIQVAWGLTSPSWSDPTSKAHDKNAYCYAVASRFMKSNNASHHSAPMCWWGTKSERVVDIPAWRLGGHPGAGASWSTAHGLAHLAGWGATDGELTVAAWLPRHGGKHLLQVRYANTNGSLSSGISAAHKRVRLTPAGSAKPTVDGAVVMPQLGTQHRWGESTVYGPFTATAGVPMRISLSEPTGLGNMADLAAMSIYTGGKGGGPAPFNRADIAGIRLLALEGAEVAPKTGKLVEFDGKDDVQKLAAAQHVAPGVKLASWAKFALDWDDDWLYLVVVGKGFEADLKAMMVYIQAGDALPAPQPAPGLTYTNLTAMLPFTASHVIALRSKSDAGDGYGPWAGVHERSSGDWRLQTRLQPGVAMWLAGDKHTIAVRIHRAELAPPGVAAIKKLRLAAHLVHGGAGHEYKAVVPPAHAPWKTATKGYYEIDLSGAHPVANWTVK